MKASSALKQSRQDESAAAGGYTMMKLLTTKELRLPLVITVVLQIAQQLSGINAVSSVSCFDLILDSVIKQHRKHINLFIGLEIGSISIVMLLCWLFLLGRRSSEKPSLRRFKPELDEIWQDYSSNQYVSYYEPDFRYDDTF